MGFIKKIITRISGRRKDAPDKEGFTLIEVLVTITILSFCLCGILLTYVNMFILTDLLRNFTLANNALQAEGEKIKKTNFDGLSAFNGYEFDVGGFASSNAKGRIEVTDTAYPDLKRVRIILCFKSRARVIGEDTNFDGSLNYGEDLDGNGRLDSPVELVSFISR